MYTEVEGGSLAEVLWLGIDVRKMEMIGWNKPTAVTVSTASTARGILREYTFIVPL